MWRPALEVLERVDPGRHVLALDLPGHGASPRWTSYDLAGVGDGVRRAVEEVGIESPVLIGHSMAAVIATTYASRHPTAGVVNVDQPLQIAPFASMVQSLRGQLRGPDFPILWERFTESMHVELLPPDARAIIEATSRPDQELVLGYWQEVLDRPVEELANQAADDLTQLAAGALPYVVVAGSEPPPQYADWLRTALPQVSVEVWPGTGHFPHLALPAAFADLLAATAGWR